MFVLKPAVSLLVVSMVSGQFLPNLRQTPQWWQSDVMPDNGILKALLGRSAASVPNLGLNTMLVSLLSGRREQLPAYNNILAAAARNRMSSQVHGLGTTHNHDTHAHSHDNHAHDHHHHAHDHHNHAHHHHDHTHHHHDHTHSHDDHIHAHPHDHHNHTHNVQPNATDLVSKEQNISVSLEQNKTIDFQLNGTNLAKAHDNQSATSDTQSYTSHNRTTPGHLNTDNPINQAIANETRSFDNQNETYTKNQSLVNQPNVNSNEHLNTDTPINQAIANETRSFNNQNKTYTQNQTFVNQPNVNSNDSHVNQGQVNGQQASTANGTDSQAYINEYRTKTLDQRSEPRANTLPYHYEPQDKQQNTQNAHTPWLQTLQRQYWVGQIFKGIRALYSQSPTNSPQSANGATGTSGHQGHPNTFLALILLLLRQYSARTMSTHSNYGGEPEKPWSDGLYNPHSGVAAQSSTPVAASGSTDTGYDNTLTNMLTGHTDHHNANSASHNKTADKPTSMPPQYNVLQPDNANTYSSPQYTRQPTAHQDLIGILQHTITPAVTQTQAPIPTVHNPSTVVNFSPFGNNHGSQMANSGFLSGYAWDFVGETAHGHDRAVGRSVSPDVSSDMRGNMTESQYERTLDILSRQPANPTVYYPGQVVNPIANYPAYQYAGLAANPTAQYASLALNPSFQTFNREGMMAGYQFGAEPEEFVAGF